MLGIGAFLMAGVGMSLVMFFIRRTPVIILALLVLAGVTYWQQTGL